MITFQIGFSCPTQLLGLLPHNTWLLLGKEPAPARDTQKCKGHFPNEHRKEISHLECWHHIHFREVKTKPRQMEKLFQYQGLTQKRRVPSTHTWICMCHEVLDLTDRITEETNRHFLFDIANSALNHPEKRWVKAFTSWNTNKHFSLFHNENYEDTQELIKLIKRKKKGSKKRARQIHNRKFIQNPILHLLLNFLQMYYTKL